MDALLLEFPTAGLLGAEAPYTAVGRARDRGDDPKLLAQIHARVEPSLPIRCEVKSVALFEEAEPDRWRARDRFPLGSKAGSPSEHAVPER